jgi:two-component system, OmpR family, sensor histidine kinase KdpD
VTRLLVAAVSVAFASALGVALGAGTTTAALLLFLAVVLASLLGYAAGALASAAGFLSLNFFFTPPVHTFAVEAGEDVFALFVFLVVSAVVATLVARTIELRAEAEQGIVEQLRLGVEAEEARLQAAVGRTRSGFLSAVSHNLRTPLAAIKASVSALLAPDARLDRADERELLETIYSETDRLERLVTKVLDLSRIRAGGLEPDPQPADLAGLAQTAIRRLRPIARGHLVRLDLPDDLPELRLDVTMIEQVFLNLLENALRFAPPGSEIRVAARCEDGGVVVRVADHGPGIPEADRERVFAEFVQGDPRPEGPGTGLGLAIVRAMVLAHDGTVWCEETPGGGATLAFKVPA